MARSNRPAAAQRSFTAVIERHQADLPVYLMVPRDIAEAFGKQCTFVVEAIVKGQAVGRRSIKPWGDGRWFMELTKQHCQRLGIQEGDDVTVEVSFAPETPPELAARIGELELEERWSRLTQAQRRSFAEAIFAAKKEATRQARIARTIAWLQRSG